MHGTSQLTVRVLVQVPVLITSRFSIHHMTSIAVGPMLFAGLLAALALGLPLAARPSPVSSQLPPVSAASIRRESLRSAQVPRRRDAGRRRPLRVRRPGRALHAGPSPRRRASSRCSRGTTTATRGVTGGTACCRGWDVRGNGVHESTSGSAPATADTATGSAAPAKLSSRGRAWPSWLSTRTYIRLESGASVAAVTLNRTYGEDIYYPANPNDKTKCPTCDG